MKKLKRILFIIFIILLIFSGVVYIDYYISSTRNTYPKISISKKIDDELTVYNAVFYRMWYCKSNKTYTIGDYKDPDATCKIVYKYNKGYYTNGSGIKISQHDLEIIKDYYDSEIIETMNSDSAIDNAVYVSNNYNMQKYNEVTTEEGNPLFSGKYSLITFNKFEKNDEGNYSWVNDEDNVYCLDLKENGISKIAPYVENKCGEFTNLTYDTKWCELYVNSNLAFDEDVNNICKSLEVEETK